MKVIVGGIIEKEGNYVRTAVINQNNNLVAPIDIVDILKD